MILSVSIAACAAGLNLSCQDHAATVGPRPLVDFIEARAAIEDAYVVGATPNLNTGSSQILRLEASDRRILVRFDQAEIAAIVGGDSLAGAILQLTVTATPVNWDEPYQFLALHRVTQSWTEAGATWNCAVDTDPGNANQDCVAPNTWVMGAPESSRPFVATSTASAPINNGSSGVIQFNVTADVRAFLVGTPNRGWLLKKADEAQEGQVNFGSKESATKPQLLLGIVQGDTSRPPIPALPYRLTSADTARLVASSSSASIQYVRDLFDVRFHDSTSGSTVRAFFSRYGGQIIGGVPAAKMYTFRIPDPGPSRPARDSLFFAFQHESGVAYVAPVLYRGEQPVVHGRYPNDGLHAQRSDWLNVTSGSDMWAGRAIALPQAWGCETGAYGGTARVGVADFVFDTAAADIDSNVSAFHHLEHGSDTIASDSMVLPSFKHHGTQVSALLAARGDNGIGISGVMWRADLELFALSNGNGYVPRDVGKYFATVVLPLAASQQVRVLSVSVEFSLGETGPEALPRRQRIEQAIADYLTPGNLLVYALPDTAIQQTASMFANEGGALTPAIGALIANDAINSRNGLIVVAGTDPTRHLYQKSAFITDENGNYMIAAPAVSVLSILNGGGVGFGTGNSFGAPLVAGTLGLLFSMDSTLLSSDAKSMLLLGARDSVTTTSGAQVPAAVLDAPGPLYELNAYSSLRRLARMRAHAPVCGFLVRRGNDWASVVLERPGMSAESLPVPQTTSGVYGVSVAQGGRLIAIHDYDANGQITRLIDHAGASLGTRSNHRHFLERDTAEVQDATDPATSYPYQTFTIHRADGSSSPVLNPYQGLIVEYYFSRGWGMVSPDASAIALTVVANCVSGCTVHTSSFVVPVATMQRITVADDQWSFYAGGPGDYSYPEDVEMGWTHDGRAVVFLRKGGICTPGQPNCTPFTGITEADPSGNHTAATAMATRLIAPRFTADDSLLVVGAANLAGTTCDGQYRAMQAPFGVVHAAPANVWNCRHGWDIIHQPNLRAGLAATNLGTGVTARSAAVDLTRPAMILSRPRRPGIAWAVQAN